jgi:predicted exporter
MRQSTSLTLVILKSLYPQAKLYMTGKGFMATYTEDEANKLIEDSVVTMSQIVEMLVVNMS